MAPLSVLEHSYTGSHTLQEPLLGFCVAQKLLHCEPSVTLTSAQSLTRVPRVSQGPGGGGGVGGGGGEGGEGAEGGAGGEFGGNPEIWLTSICAVMQPLSSMLAVLTPFLM